MGKACTKHKDYYLKWLQICSFLIVSTEEWGECSPKNLTISVEWDGANSNEGIPSPPPKNIPEMARSTLLESVFKSFDWLSALRFSGNGPA